MRTICSERPAEATHTHVRVDAEAIEEEADVKLEEFQKGMMEWLPASCGQSELHVRAKNKLEGLTALHLIQPVDHPSA